MKKRSKKAQVWIETVIYTLIALVLIGAVLAFVKPKLQELQDKAIIDQTVQVMEGIDAKIHSVVQGGAGNKRIIELQLKKGAIKIQSYLALKILRANMPKLIDLKINYVDKGIVKYANTHPSSAIATLDSELKKKIKNSKLVIRGKKKLEVQ